MAVKIPYDSSSCLLGGNRTDAEGLGCKPRK